MSRSIARTIGCSRKQKQGSSISSTTFTTRSVCTPPWVFCLQRNLRRRCGCGQVQEPGHDRKTQGGGRAEKAAASGSRECTGKGASRDMLEVDRVANERS